MIELFQSTLPVWGATTTAAKGQLNPNISIHAPRVGSDGIVHRNAALTVISIHAPRVGSDRILPRRRRYKIFQSTLPVWGATPSRTPSGAQHKNFNPRSPCGERPLPRAHHGSCSAHFNPRSPCGERRKVDVLTVYRIRISIHAPRVGSDPNRRIRKRNPRRFQSTLPVWGAT